MLAAGSFFKKDDRGGGGLFSIYPALKILHDFHLNELYAAIVSVTSISIAE